MHNREDHLSPGGVGVASGLGEAASGCKTCPPGASARGSSSAHTGDMRGRATKLSCCSRGNGARAHAVEDEAGEARRDHADVGEEGVGSDRADRQRQHEQQDRAPVVPAP